MGPTCFKWDLRLVWFDWLMLIDGELDWVEFKHRILKVKEVE